jgi:cytochrome c biogenesis protein CcdA
MKRKTSTFFLVLAVFNILVGVIPPCVGGFGAASFMSETKININNRELGPELEKHIAKNAPLAKVEAFGALAMNVICSLMLIGGAVGLFLSQPWARWLSVAGGLSFILALLIHDVYQIFFYRPVLMSFIDMNVPARGVLADGIKWGTTVSVLMWSCTNPLLMIYLFVMSLCMALMTGFHDAAIRAENEDDEEEERPTRKRRKRIDDSDDDDDRPPRRKRRDRDED